MGAVLLTQAWGTLETWADADADGRRAAIRVRIDALGRVNSLSAGARGVTFGLDDLGRVVSVTDPAGITEHVEFDLRGEVVSFTDANGRTIGREVDDRGLLVRDVDPAGVARTYEHDAAGRLVRDTSRAGEVIEHTYDDAGRLVETTGPGVFVRYTYDALSRPITIENGTQVLDLAYDDDTDAVLSTLATGSGFPDVLFEYAWTPGGRLVGSTSPYGSTGFEYDDEGRPVTLADSLNGTYGWSWRADGRLDSLDRPTGLSTAVDYTPGGRLAGLTTLSAMGQTLQDDRLERGPDGRIAELTDWSGTHAYTYDDNGQLVLADHPSASGVPDEAYAYDAMGNRSDWTGNPDDEVVYDALDRLVQDGSFRYAYDAEGRLVRREDRVSDEPTTYTWNAFDELVRIDHPDGTATTYAYDPVGRRVEVVHAGEAVRMGFDGGDLRLIFDGDGELTSWQTTDPWGDLLAEYDPALGTSRDALLGYLGTLEGWADEQGVDYVARDTFGNSPVASADLEPHALTWHPQDPNGLVFAGARYLDPTTGRFLSQDPMSSGNLYAYAMNDPVNAWDPYGLTAASEDGMIRKQSAKAPTPGATRIGLDLVCKFNTFAAIVNEIVPPNPGFGVVIEVIDGGCGARGKRVPIKCSLCLTGDAEVQLVEGEAPIADVEIGDRVLSHEPGTGKWLPVAEGASTPGAPESGTWRFDSRTGTWVRSEPGPDGPGEWLVAGHLVWIGVDGAREELGRASRSALSRADLAFGEGPEFPPTAADWVWSLDEGRHGRLGDLAPATRVAFRGRVWETDGQGAIERVRASDQVLGRVVRTFRRMATEVVELEVEHADGRVSTIAGTPCRFG